MTRRAFALSAAAMYARGHAAAASTRPALCLFSKHLPNFNYTELARTVKQMGFDGVDLTVRAQGHVLPDRVADDLPRAAAAIRAEGLALPMITTGLISPADPTARPTLKTAADLHIPFFKLGYWHYTDGTPVEARIAEVRRDVAGLVAIAKESGITAGYHNHSGNYVGAAVWDTRAIIADLDPRSIGYYFDPCHATVEGGEGGWVIALGVALPRLKMVALKDFYWEKREGKWRMEMCPMGEGMVNWPKFFSTLAQARFAGPISVHVEYEAADMPAAIARDFAFVRKQVDAAYRGV
jgi:sugar phosphate isomerase/epimerase